MENSNKKMIWKDGRAQEVEEKTHEKSNEGDSTFCVILEDGQMKRVDEYAYQQWKEEKKDHFATSIVQPQSGQTYGVYFKGDNFNTICEDPQVWYLIIDDMTLEDYDKLKEKYPDIEGIDEMTASFNAEQRLGEEPFMVSFATQSELLKYVEEKHINDDSERAYYLGVELPFNY